MKIKKEDLIMAMYHEYPMGFYNGRDSLEIVKLITDCIQTNHSELYESLDELHKFKNFESMFGYINVEISDEILEEILREVEISIVLIRSFLDFNRPLSLDVFLKSGKILREVECKSVKINYGNGIIAVDPRSIEGFENENFDIVAYYDDDC